MSSQNLLIEVGCEELPPKSLTTLASALADNIEQELTSIELTFTKVTWYATPRRLAVVVSDLAYQQADKVIEKRGPAVSAAFDGEGNPTKAAMGWARGNDIDVADAQRLSTEKGEWLVHNAEIKGQTLPQLIEKLVNNALNKLPISKPMRWGSNKTQFIRPVHSITLLYGDQLLAATVLGKTSSKTLYGHRFHGEKTFELEHVDNYLAHLEQHFVIADFERRKQLINESILAIASTHNAVADIDTDLLNEVTALVEYPVALEASFEESFLDVPKEALIYTMKGDQKYFPLLSKAGELLAKFVFITNIQSKDPVQIIQGNERVIRPRLADAEFFYQTDKKQRLDSRVEKLESVIFQKQLGTLKDKSLRVSQLAGKIASRINADVELAKRAGLLCKADLMSNMVMEFPDVQGVMGMYYAKNDGEDNAVAVALNEQYQPRFAGDTLPTADISCALALADKLDTLVGIFGIGLIPKGDKDPFALRRAAIGLLRIIAENQLPLDLIDLIQDATDLFTDKLTNKNVTEDVLDFINARYRAMYSDKGVSIDVIQAVQARRPTKPTDFAARIIGVAHFATLDNAISLAAANKRVGNILAKNAADIDHIWSSELLVEPAEQQLADALQQVKSAIAPLLITADYQNILTKLASLRVPIDAFFDSVMVMADDEKIKRNRMALLKDLQAQFLNVADISLLN
ncbi:glycine--tRNA ligase subunit beta [Alteromonadaceae bacterium BrNp21-10]|nr:glycine--tRNA ligase subunit beta [Alteromonadaceae bacterium BrNp21-10]